MGPFAMREIHAEIHIFQLNKIMAIVTLKSTSVIIIFNIAL